MTKTTDLARACGAATDWDSQPRNDPELDDSDFLFTSAQLEAFAERIRADERECKHLGLGKLDELAKVYGIDYASPHHITFTVDGLRGLIKAVNATR